MICIELRARIKSLSAQYNFRASHVLDQYFLVDNGVIERAIRYAQLDENDTVFEIGPGLGFITEQIIPHVKKVIAVEKDKKLQPLLEQEFKDKNIQFIFEDFLEAKLPEFNKIVSNIPYSLSAPITFKLIEHNFERAVLFYQKEFGQKMIAKPAESNYGRLSVMVQHYFNVELKEIVNRHSFHPQPETDACIMVLSKKPIQIDKEFDIFVRELFRYKNKDVKNAMKIAFNRDIEDNRKVFQLSIPEIIELYGKERK